MPWHANPGLVGNQRFYVISAQRSLPIVSKTIDHIICSILKSVYDLIEIIMNDY